MKRMHLSLSSANHVKQHYYDHAILSESKVHQPDYFQ